MLLYQEKKLSKQAKEKIIDYNDDSHLRDNNIISYFPKKEQHLLRSVFKGDDEKMRKVLDRLKEDEEDDDIEGQIGKEIEHSIIKYNISFMWNINIM